MDIDTWYDEIKKLCNEIPVVLCGNKADLEKNNLTAEEVAMLIEENLQYYGISAKSNYNLKEPFLYLAKKLTR